MDQQVVDEVDLNHWPPPILLSVDGWLLSHPWNWTPEMEIDISRFSEKSLMEKMIIPFFRGKPRTTVIGLVLLGKLEPESPISF